MQEPDVTIYTTSTWPYCHMATDFFREKGIAYKEIDVSEDREAAREMVRKSNQTGVPVIDIRGDIVVGFNRKRIEELLAA